MPNDFRQFSVDLDNFVKQVGLSAQAVQKKVAFDLFRRIVKKTPVDTGRARASWTISANGADQTVISNNVPYITALEDGHSKKAPVGMVKVSIAEIDVAMRRLVDEGIKEAGL